MGKGAPGATPARGGDEQKYVIGRNISFVGPAPVGYLDGTASPLNFEEIEMSLRFTGFTATQAGVLAALFAACATPAGAAINTDFSNPAVAMSGAAVIASGTCIAKYTAQFDDAAKPVAAVSQLVAKRCAQQIARSAGLATWMSGRPDDFAKNLKYTRDDLTANTVVRYRAAKRSRAD